MNENVTQVHNTTTDELINQIVIGVKNQLQEIKENFQPKKPNEWLTRDEVAKYLKISTVTVDDWRKKGILISYKIGKNIRFKRSEIEAALIELKS